MFGTCKIYTAEKTQTLDGFYFYLKKICLSIFFVYRLYFFRLFV